VVYRVIKLDGLILSLWMDVLDDDRALEVFRLSDGLMVFIILFVSHLEYINMVI